MGKSRSSVASLPPRETPEQFKKRYDKAKEDLEKLTYIDKNGNTKNVFSASQVKKLLDAVLNENIHLKGIEGRGTPQNLRIVFEERFDDGTSTPLKFKASLVKELVKGEGVKINDLMDEYGKLPVLGRKATTAYNIGTPGGNGGHYNPNSNEVFIHSKLFTDKKSPYTTEWCKHVLQHETTHALDHAISGMESNFINNLMGRTMATTLTDKYAEVMLGEKGSNYSESYRGGDHYEAETLADTVATVRLGREYGESVHMNGRNGQTLAQWKKENKNLYDFANKFVDCKSMDELRNLFEI